MSIRSVLADDDRMTRFRIVAGLIPWMAVTPAIIDWVSHYPQLQQLVLQASGQEVRLLLSVTIFALVTIMWLLAAYVLTRPFAVVGNYIADLYTEEERNER